MEQDRTVKVLVFAKGDKAKEVEQAGADYVGAEEMVQKSKKKTVGFRCLCCNTRYDGSCGRLGRILGPKGLMPNPKSGTVTMDVSKGCSRYQGR